MSTDVYQAQVMALSKDESHAGSLPAPSASATVDNALCGDRVKIDLTVAEGRITDIRHHVRGCVLCKASAVAMSAAAIGRDAQELAAARQAVSAMLKEKAPAPGAPWTAYAAFSPVADYKSRHTCVLLPFDALQKALGMGR